MDDFIIDLDDEKGLHDGHRQRLLNLAVEAGLDAMSDIQVMELFLTYILPRGDVNPLAHKLLEKYSNFTQVIEANLADLKMVKGVNDRSAKKINLFSEFFYYFVTARMKKKFKVDTMKDVIDVLEDFLRFRPTENIIMLGINASNIITHHRRIKSESKNEVSVSALEVANFLANAKPAAFVIGHCHPYGKAEPSPSDADGLEMCKEICRTCGVNFIDSFIIGDDGVYSQKDQEMVRTYHDVEDLKKVLNVVK